VEANENTHKILAGKNVRKISPLRKIHIFNENLTVYLNIISSTPGLFFPSAFQISTFCAITAMPMRATGPAKYDLFLNHPNKRTLEIKKSSVLHYETAYTSLLFQIT
jgi:hypothetical protein